MRSAVQVYALIVCFATLMCFIVALGIAVYDVVQMSTPEFTLLHFQPYHSNSTYRQFYPDAKDVPDAEVTQLREQALLHAFAAERRNAMQSGVFMAIVLVIDLTVFAVHWLIARREQPPLRAIAV